MSFIEANVLSDAEIAQVLDFADTVGGWIKSVRAEAFKRACQRQGSIEGWKLAEGNASRDWLVPPEEVPQRLLALCPALQYDDLFDRALVSVPKAEALLKQHFKGRGHKEKFDEFNKKLVNKTTSASSTLVRVTDARPEKRRGQEFLARVAKTATTDIEDLL